VRAPRPIRVRTGAGFAPLYAAVPTPERAARMIGARAAATASLDGGWVVVSLGTDDPRFRPTLYWRGPVWPILNWVLYGGLLAYGHGELAAELRHALLELPRKGGFWEHYDPLTGRGHGGEQFAWTAGLVLDLLYATPPETHVHVTD
jgi:glycogen debranching enzyme